MTAEIAAMGARTPHELMRCAEVTFIRDCAELAARASLAREESRWGLYHDRPDHPSAGPSTTGRPPRLRVRCGWPSPRG
jgi:succinate dehydrogenase/fumarate reductase flavoprotein subunit